jgi:mRNA interferase MazF
MKAYTMPIRPGEFWVADIPFTDGSASKKRPILVLWLDGLDVVVAAVTSAPPRTATDIALSEWKSSGLRVASTVRLSRLDCLEQSLLKARLGAVSVNDAQVIKQIWTSRVQPQF